MPVYKNNNVLIAYKGDYKPVNIYKGSEKIAGWEEKTFSGTNLNIDGTYNDEFHSLMVSGRYEREETTQSSNLFYYDRDDSYTRYDGLFTYSFSKDTQIFTIDGTPTQEGGHTTFLTNAIKLKTGTVYTLKVFVLNGTVSSNLSVMIRYNKGLLAPANAANNWRATFTPTTSDIVTCGLYWYGTSVANNLQVKIMLCEGNVNPTEYVPFVPDRPSLLFPSYPTFSGNCNLYAGNSEIDIPVLRAVPLFGDTLTSDILTWDGAGWTFTQYSAEYEILGTETIIQWIAGGENWVSGNYIAFGIHLPVSGGTIDYCGICSHFPLQNNLGINYVGYADYNCFTMRTSPITAVIKIKWADLGFGSMPTYATALPVFRQWLTDQRTNGTPVKVWYIKTTYPMLTVPKTTPKVTTVYDDGEVQTNKQVTLKVFGRD